MPPPSLLWTDHTSWSHTLNTLFPALFQVATPESSDASCSVHTFPDFTCSAMSCGTVTGIYGHGERGLQDHRSQTHFRPGVPNAHAATSLVRLGQVEATPPPPAQCSWRKTRWCHNTTTTVPSHVLTSSGRAEFSRWAFVAVIREVTGREGPEALFLAGGNSKPLLSAPLRTTLRSPGINNALTIHMCFPTPICGMFWHYSVEGGICMSR